MLKNLARLLVIGFVVGIVMGLLTTAPAQAGTRDTKPPNVCLGKPGKVICASKADKRVYALYNGRVVRYHDSRYGGKASDGSGPWFTREGKFRVNWKSPARKSTLYRVWMYDVLNFSGGQHIHYSPEFAQYGWRYGSHGCVGLRNRTFSKWLYKWAPVGTRVIVTRN